jgi:non-ribosomal peptide synthetase component F
MSHAPLFQVVFSLQNAPTMANSDAPAATADASDSTPQADTSTSKFDLTVSTAEVGRNLLGAFEYNTDLFEPATIERMVGHYRRLLEAVVANPEQRLSDIRLIDESETSGCSLSDFPDAELSQKDFENLIQKISEVAVQE